MWLDIPLDVQAANVALSDMPAYDPGDDEILFDTALLEQQAAELLERIRRSSARLSWLATESAWQARWTIFIS